MGYNTTFDGRVTVEPPLNGPEIAFLRKFAASRHWNRRQGPYVLGDEDSPTHPIPNSYNTPHPDLPSLWCNWVPNEDGTALEWNGMEKFHDADVWMEYLIDTFLRPEAVLEAERSYPHPHWEYPAAFRHFTCDHVLNGTITAQGEEPDDQWTLRVEDNHAYRRAGHHARPALPPPGSCRLTVTYTCTLPTADLLAAPEHATAFDIARSASTRQILEAGHRRIVQVADGVAETDGAVEVKVTDHAGEEVHCPVPWECTVPHHTHEDGGKLAATCRNDDA